MFQKSQGIFEEFPRENLDKLVGKLLMELLEKFIKEFFLRIPAVFFSENLIMFCGGNPIHIYGSNFEGIPV